MRRSATSAGIRGGPSPPCPSGARGSSRLRYLDSIGILASLGNQLFLRRSIPTPGQISLWDGVMVRLSRLVDPLLLYSVGKSVLAVWQKRRERL